MAGGKESPCSNTTSSMVGVRECCPRLQRDGPVNYGRQGHTNMWLVQSYGKGHYAARGRLRASAYGEKCYTARGSVRTSAYG